MIWLVSLVAGVAFAAPKLLPLLELMRLDRVDQTVYHDGGNYDLVSLFTSLAGTREDLPFLWLGVGVAGLVLAGVAIAVERRRSLGLAALFIATGSLAMGPESPLPLSYLLRMLPILGSLNSEGKYFSVSVLFCVCGLIALGTERLLASAVPWIATRLAAPSRPAGLAAHALVYLVALVPPIVQNRPVFNRLFSLEDRVPPRESFHHVASREWLGRVDRYRISQPAGLIYDSVRRGVGTLTWYGNMVFPENAKAKVLLPVTDAPEAEPGYRGELYCAEVAEPACRVSGLRLSYNTMRFEITSTDSTVAVINVNYHPGWSSHVGQVVGHDGLLAVRVPGRYAGPVELTFADIRFWAGCVVLAVAACVWFGGGTVWTRRRARPAVHHSSSG